MQARKIFENREDTGRDHTIFSGSDAQVDERGPELAAEAAEVAGRLLRNKATIRWTPAHQVADGNEVAGEWAKAVAKSVYLPVRQVWLSCPEASRRKRQRERRNGSTPTSGESADTALPIGSGRIRKELGREAPTSRYYQFPSGHAPAGSRLCGKIHRITTSECC